MRVEQKLNPYLETIALLIVSTDIQGSKKEQIEVLEELGIDGEAFFEKYLQVWEKYVEIFKAHLVREEDVEVHLKKCKSQSLSLLILVIALEFEEEITKGEELDEAQLHEDIVSVCQKALDIKLQREDIGCAEKLMTFLQQERLDEEEKWGFMQVLLKPKEYFELIGELIRVNIEAYKHASGAIGEEVSKEIPGYLEFLESDEYRGKSAEKIMDQDGVCFPMLAFPISNMIKNDCSFIGLFYPKLLSHQPSDVSKEAIIKALKAIGDKTRLDILASLKKNPKYNLEIAGLVGVSAPTVSHHMSILQVNNLVTISKKSGKVYYHINEEEVRELLESLENLLV